jgi:hypothetical protein
MMIGLGIYLDQAYVNDDAAGQLPPFAGVSRPPCPIIILKDGLNIRAEQGKSRSGTIRQNLD